MSSTLNPDLRIPTPLSRQGRRAAQVILGALEQWYLTYTGGCRAFYTPEEWLLRGERYGTGSLLVVVHDGGDIASIMDDGKLFESLQHLLGHRAGVYLEPCTCWYSAVYPSSGGIK